MKRKIVSSICDKIIGLGPVWNEGIQNAGIGKNAGIRYDEK